MRARRTYSSDDDTGTTISTLTHANERKCKRTQTNANKCKRMPHDVAAYIAQHRHHTIPVKHTFISQASLSLKQFAFLRKRILSNGSDVALAPPPAGVIVYELSILLWAGSRGRNWLIDPRVTS